MRKDPTEFRERFKKWQSGEKVYEAGLPKYEDGYESFLATLPDNQKKPGAYNTRRYWELNGKPKNFAEAIGQGMYTFENDNAWHANSVAYNDKNDTYEFMKPNYHETRWMELVLGYDKDPEFLKEWKVKYNGPMLSDRYVRREKPGLKVKGGQLPEFGLGTEGSGVEYDDETYKKFNWAFNDENEYLNLVSKGYPEKEALKYMKYAVKNYPNNYYISGPTLPDVVVKPNPNSTSTALLTTYYPWSTDFPITGHSTLELIHPDSDDGYTGFVTAYGDDPWYNFVTNNCSDSTREAIENATGKKIDPLLFTTPGDVKDFVESRLRGKSKTFDDGHVETVFTIPTKQARKIVDYANKQQRLRHLSRRHNGGNNKYAE